MRAAATLADLKIHDAAKMSKTQRKAVADWLRMHAEDIVKDGAEYDRGFKGRIFRR